MLNSVALVFADDMAVDSGRGSRVAGSQLPLRHSRSCAVSEQRASRAMPQRMESAALDSEHVQKQMQLFLPQFVRREWPSASIAE